MFLTDEDTDWDAYYNQEDQGTGDINAIKEEDEIVEILYEVGLHDTSFSDYHWEVLSSFRFLSNRKNICSRHLRFVFNRKESFKI